MNARRRLAPLLLPILVLGCAAPPEDASSRAAAAPSTSPAADRMAWWRDARFGMFIHWGVYSELGGAWEGKPASGTGEWIFQNAKPPMSAYEQVAARFDPVRYDPRAWARLAKEAGMKYVVITSKHHDGFCLWDSALTDWDVSRTPSKRDLLEPLAKACRDEGLAFGLYFSIMDWRHPDYAPRRPWNDLAAAAGPPDFARFRAYVGAQLEEIVRRFEPDVLWFDGEWEDTWTVEAGAELEARLRALRPRTLMNNRVGKSRNDMAGLDRPGVPKAGDFGTPEQEVPPQGIPGVDWETCMTMNDTWGFRADDERWKSPTTLIRTLVDVASKGGNFLLNVGPTGKGEIPAASVERLRAIGVWMRKNGEAIYGTEASPWGAVPWGRVTRKGDAVYACVFERPADGRVRLPIRRTSVVGASLLADATAKVVVEGDAAETILVLPSDAADPACTVVRVTLAAPGSDGAAVGR